MNLSDKKGDKFGIFQSSDASCVFYKEDKDGNQSTFNLFVLPDKNEKKLFAYIDNFQLDEKVWHSDKKISLNDAIKAFNEWAVDAPVLFELEAHKSLSQCLKNFMVIE
jgi:uncharacterized phage-like protein YoqJ